MSKRATMTATFDVPDDAIEQASVLSKLVEPKKALQEAIRQAIGEDASLTIVSKVVTPSPGRARPKKKAVAEAAAAAAANKAATGTAQTAAGAPAGGANKKQAA